MSQAVYDRYGRLQYNPEIHDNQFKRWNKEDVDYLITYYSAEGPDAVAFALGRTVQTVMQKAYELRKSGQMPLPQKRTYHKRVGSL